MRFGLFLLLLLGSMFLIHLLIFELEGLVQAGGYAPLKKLALYSDCITNAFAAAIARPLRAVKFDFGK